MGCWMCIGEGSNMSKLIRVVVMLPVLLFFGLVLHAQEDDGPPAGEKPDSFRLVISAASVSASVSAAGRVSHSLYSRLEVIDERPDSGKMGWLGNGTYYGLQVCLADPLDTGLDRLLRELTDSTAADGSLVVEMRRFIVYDEAKHSAISLRFRLFGGVGGGYVFLRNVDTTVYVRSASGRGGRRKFTDAVNGALSAAIAGVLRIKGDSAAGVFTRALIPFADQIWKKQSPLYQAEVYPDGAYLHFSSFLRLRPDYVRFRIADTVHPEKCDFIFLATAQDPAMLVYAGQLYALVVGGKAYISFDGVFKPMIRRDGELYITGKLRVDAPGADMAVDMASFVVSAASVLRLPFVQVWGLTVKKKFLFQLDYSTGRFVPVRAVE
jgi:hypothetical protein